MANPIIKILRGAGAPPTLEAGRIAIDQLNKNLVVGIDDGNGGTINEIVGGSGTFATKAFVSNAVTTATGNLGTMSTQNADAVAITGGSISGASVTNLPAPSADGDAATKKYTDDKVSALGSVFHYVGDVSAATGNDLTTLSDQNTGAYYRVDVAGTYTAGADSFAAKVGDAFVKTSTGWQKLDNVDAQVLGTANEIAVTGDENAGYTVALDTAFKGRVSDVETKTQNIDLAATTAGTTGVVGDIRLVNFAGDNPTSVGTVVSHGGFDAYASAGDNYFSVNYDGITLGPQYNNWGVQIRQKLEGVEKNGSLPTIENFIIDGGTY